ncbi:histidine kinase N-terminal 7TM domain-containing protein [Halomicroarcula sp. GCM10025894]
MSIEPFLIALFVSVFVVVLVTVFFYRNRSIPGVKPLLVASVAEMWWLLCYAGELFSPSPAQAVLFDKLEWAGAVVIPLAWLIFVLEYTGRGQYLSRNRLVALAVPPVATLVAVAVAFEPLVGPNPMILRSEGVHVVVTDTGVVYWLSAVYSWLLITSSLVLLVEFVVDRRELYQGQAVALTGAGAVPLAANIVATTGTVDLDPFTLTPLTFALSSGLVALAILEFDAFRTVPIPHHLATDTALSAVDDPIVVFDGEGTVVDCNRAACSTLNRDRQTLVGAQRESLTPLADVDSESAGSTVTVEHDGEPTHYDVQTAAIDAGGDSVLGTVVTMRDVTERRERKQRLNTLNEVLRATIQEEMTTVQQVVDDGDSEEILDRASMALGVSDRAGDLASMMDSHAASPADIVPIIHEEIEAAREWKPEVSFVLDATLGEWAYCSGLFEPVFRVSLRHAAERSLQEVPEPVVGISVDAGPESVTVSVSDIGQPLSDHERAVLRGEARPQPSDQADMSRWLVNWG